MFEQDKVRAVSLNSACNIYCFPFYGFWFSAILYSYRVFAVGMMLCFLRFSSYEGNGNKESILSIFV